MKRRLQTGGQSVLHRQKAYQGGRLSVLDELAPAILSGSHSEGLLEVAVQMALVEKTVLDGDLCKRSGRVQSAFHSLKAQLILVGVGRETKLLAKNAYEVEAAQPSNLGERVEGHLLGAVRFEEVAFLPLEPLPSSHSIHSARRLTRSSYQIPP